MFLTQNICSVEAPSSNISEVPSLITVSSMLEHDNAALGQLVDVDDADSVATVSSVFSEGRLLVDIDETSSTSSFSDSPPPPLPPMRRPRLNVRLQVQDWETWKSNNNNK